MFNSMQLAARCFGVSTYYRWLCATGAAEWKRESAARACNDLNDEWICGGCPFRRALWLAAWTTHGILWPLRRTIGV